VVFTYDEHGGYYDHVPPPNQSMWRCVPGSAFFKPYDCNPGEVGTKLAPEE
jgi:phospholipase C